MATMLGRILRGLRVSDARGVTLVDDGQTRWLCRTRDWNQAVTNDRGKFAREHTTDEDIGVAYGELCSEIAALGPIASRETAWTDEAGSLAILALDAGLIDEDEWLGRKAIEPRAESRS